MSLQREEERQTARERIAKGDPPWHHAVGLMAAVEAVRDVRFPVSRAQLTKRAGDRYIQASDSLVVPIAEVVAHLPEREFTSLREWTRAVQKHWEGVRFLEVPQNDRLRGARRR